MATPKCQGRFSNPGALGRSVCVCVCVRVCTCGRPSEGVSLVCVPVRVVACLPLSAMDAHMALVLEFSRCNSPDWISVTQLSTPLPAEEIGLLQ